MRQSAPPHFVLGARAGLARHDLLDVLDELHGWRFGSQVWSEPLVTLLAARV
jgi:hypothetical protein